MAAFNRGTIPVFVLVTLAVVCMISVTSAAAANSSFGYTNVGTSAASTFGGIYVCNFTSPSDLGNITAVNVYLSTGGSSARAVIYSDSNGKPDVLLAQSNTVDVEGTSGRWVSFDVSLQGIPGGVYWMGVVLDSAGSYYYQNVSGKAIYSSNVIDNINLFPSDSSVSSSNLSVYADYIPNSDTGSESSGNSSWIQYVLVGIAVTGVVIAMVLAVLVLRGNKKKAAT